MKGHCQLLAILSTKDVMAALHMVKLVADSIQYLEKLLSFDRREFRHT